MGALRDSIKVIFDEKQVEQVIAALCDEASDPDKLSVSSLHKGAFASAYTNVSNRYTEDQAKSSFNIASTTWSQPTEDRRLVFCKHKNIFNILLHFTSQLLKEEKNAPVCRFEHLLKWHEITYRLGEDMFTTAFLASKDIYEAYERKNFSWPALIDHDNAALNQLYTREMADIHNHLKGTGYLAELNWMSLMNDMSGRRKEFYQKDFELAKTYHASYTNIGYESSLYANVIKAAAIRLYLFGIMMGTDFLEERDSLGQVKLSGFKKLLLILREKTDIGLERYLSIIDTAVSTAKWMYGKKFQTISHDLEVVDYAILNRGDFSASNPVKNIDCILSGERYLEYNVFKKIYRGDDADNRLSMLLYIYFLIKNRFQQELVQVNEVVGFGNFADYQDRKEFFLKEGSVYEKLLVQTAVYGTLNDKGERYLETRIAPKATSSKMADAIRRTDIKARYIDQTGRGYTGWDVNESNQWHYVAHFIKSEDKSNTKTSLQNPRNWKVRNEVKCQSLAISHLREYNYQVSERLVGIDAANSEICCRPEVFAQAFRFLRDSRGVGRMGSVNKSKLGVTYHVGEDYNDIIDGLRSVQEAMMFLELGSGDRIGHGLVLGTDVGQYYEDRGYSISMSKQCVLDNVAFLLVEASELEGFQNIRKWLEQTYERLFRHIYGGWFKNILIPYNTYYQSWLLRGDNPWCYQNYNDCHCTLANKTGMWRRYDIVTETIQDDARKNPQARELYHLYHFNSDAKTKGGEYEQIQIHRSAIEVIELLQKKILESVEQKQIAIECNPSSNYKIGEMRKFKDHPISKFFNVRRYDGNDRRNICVSINTDDKGVFSTSLEREFALMACAYFKEYQHKDSDASPREVIDWLDTIREMAFEMAFVKK